MKLPKLRRLGATLALLPALLAACTPYLHQHLLATQPARLGAEIAANSLWRGLPAPKTKSVVAVYKFRDQTGQYKPQENGASFSTAVTQGATTILLRALEESQWFEPIERENLGNLLNERKIIRSTREEYAAQTGKKQPPLAPLLFAGIILEGGIVSYDSNILTGGAGLRYFGAGASGQYRQDRVTVYLRAISTNSGKIFKTVYTSKTILSQQVDASLFRFVDFKRLLETETGFTYNEPSEMAVKEAIEKAVVALIYEGFAERLWAPRDSTEYTGYGIQNYLYEKNQNLGIDVLGREMKLRRSPLALGANVAVQEYSGDYANPLRRPGAELTLHYQTTNATSLFLNAGRGQLAAGLGAAALRQTLNYAEAGVQYRLLPFDNFTPYLLLGGGAARRTTPLADAPTVLPYAVAGVGGEYLITPHLGLSVGVDNHYFLSDQLDRLSAGRYNDYYWSGRVGAVLYFGKTAQEKALAKQAKSAAEAAAEQQKKADGK
ncbi:curli production assembly/transport component CsgG [Hymenobacter sp. DH14]|uniref:Curli production assembly/transport component CsgG n=1 Tax=Hymenobacter cyanobacteriorum TaxID=2926463 RepID=A0A9X1VF97_9BACT|nr:CsgG/HfaB family protein [Hymenobacter cyanobacteriorum]MCI1188104.1 curli production assembly/transport component CsgG [Hymenobacter cyanobacteriorum]